MTTLQSAPHMMDTSKTPGLGSTSTVHQPCPRSPSPPLNNDSRPSHVSKNGAAPSKIDERIRKARLHLIADPRADNRKLAQMYELTAEQVQQLRAHA